MIRTIRTDKVSARNFDEAKKLSQEFKEYLSTHFPEVNYQQFWQRFDVGTVTFVIMSDHEDLASMERNLKREWPDAEWVQEKMSRWEDLIIEDSSEMVVLESV